MLELGGRGDGPLNLVFGSKIRSNFFFRQAWILTWRSLGIHNSKKKRISERERKKEKIKRKDRKKERKNSKKERKNLKKRNVSWFEEDSAGWGYFEWGLSQTGSG